MEAISTIGLDIAKSVFQVHGVDAAGQVVLCRRLKRRQVVTFFQNLSPCLVGIEACASSHYWSRELQALGHSVRLMPPAYVKPYVKRQKNDMADAEAICETVTRANMRFVPTKTPEQQSGLMLHRSSHLFIRQQTSAINAIRAHLAEFGIVAPVGRRGVEELLRVVTDPTDKRVPEVVRGCLAALGSQLLNLKKQILEFDRMILAWQRSNQTSKRLNCIPGVDPLLATALVDSVADPKTFRSVRNFSAWIGLVPKQYSSGGRERLGSISKRGDRYLRNLFVAGAFALIRYAKIHGTKHRPWLTALLARRPTKVAIALANKLARKRRLNLAPQLVDLDRQKYYVQNQCWVKVIPYSIGDKQNVGHYRDCPQENHPAHAEHREYRKGRQVSGEIDPRHARAVPRKPFGSA